MITSFMGAGPDILNATLAEQDMLMAARNAGPAFNPDAWWRTNGTRYITKSMEDNMQTLQENRMDKYIFTDINDPGLMDMKKVTQGVADRIKNKTMTQEEGNRVMKEINNLYRLRIQNSMLLKQKEAK